MPKLTVVTVAYNSAKTIEDTILSVRAQTGADFEHIIIDGGSQDETMQIVDRYRDGLAAVVSEPDEGIYDAMNKGLALARGTYFGCLNSDDYFASPTTLARVEQELQSRNVDGVWGNVVHVDAIGRPRRLMEVRNFHAWQLRFGLMPPHPAFYVRTDAIRAVGGFSTKYRIAGDFDLMVRMFSSREFHCEHFNEIVTVMRIGGVSTNGLAATQKISDELTDVLAQHEISTSAPAIRARYLLKLLELARGRALALRGQRFPSNWWSAPRNN
jgi:glycosyltransferase involved in cell wall biosynthesis